MLLARLLSFSLGLVFAWAALAKVMNLSAWLGALSGYRLPARVRAAAAVVTPAAETLVAGLFFSGETRVASALLLVLIAVFSLSIVRARSLQGSRLPCGCFGSMKERDARALLARNTVLGMGAGALLVFGRDVPGYPSVPSGGAWLPAVLAVTGTILMGWLLASARSGFRRDVA